MTDAAGWLDYAFVFWRIVGGVGPAIALVLVAAILAVVGGFGGWRYRLYGAMLGGMVANAFAKAEGAGFEVAFVAMLVVTTLGATIGSAGLIRTLLGRLARKEARPGS